MGVRSDKGVRCDHSLRSRRLSTGVATVQPACLWFDSALAGLAPEALLGEARYRDFGSLCLSCYIEES